MTETLSSDKKSNNMLSSLGTASVEIIGNVKAPTKRRSRRVRQEVRNWGVDAEPSKTGESRLRYYRTKYQIPDDVILRALVEGDVPSNPSARFVAFYPCTFECGFILLLPNELRQILVKIKIALDTYRPNNGLGPDFVESVTVGRSKFVRLPDQRILLDVELLRTTGLEQVTASKGDLEQLKKLVEALKGTKKRKSTHSKSSSTIGKSLMKIQILSKSHVSVTGWSSAPTMSKTILSLKNIRFASHGPQGKTQMMSYRYKNLLEEWSKVTPRLSP
ncbi:hypothetical protein Patl1_32498 [Pistacia atlantica]|uniref:Uncharacterized protein n=1 Tax=Pistacia atlantica TaxID=434234 RepID=A0ACC1APH5_9ROSI|nr:hypothetical protein Patl1_32498 [Pistacia atlantica]